MKLKQLNTPELPQGKYNLLIKFYSKRTPQAYLGKMLVNFKEGLFIYRFLKDENLQKRFYSIYEDDIKEILTNFADAKDLNDFLAQCEGKIDYDIYQDFTLEDIYTDYDLTSKHKDVISSIPIDLPKKFKTDANENDDEELDIVNNIIAIDMGEINPQNFFKDKSEEIREKYTRRGFRKDAKNPLVPIKILTSKGHYVTYYIKKTNIDDYTKRNKNVNGRWKYIFYSDEIEKSMKAAPRELQGYTKNGKYASAGVMSGMRIEVDKYVRAYTREGIRPYINASKQILNDGKLIRESVRIGESYNGTTEIRIGNERETLRGNKLRSVEINIAEAINGRRRQTSIKGVYTKQQNSFYKPTNSFHINEIQGKLSFDRINYMTNAHMKTHDMITVGIDGIPDAKTMKKFVLGGYGFNKDTKATYARSKDDLKEVVRQKYNDNSKTRKILENLLDKTKNFQELTLEVLKTGNKQLINEFFNSGLIEKYKELSGSDRLVFRTSSLSGKVTKSEKILETFEVLRDKDNDYHLGQKLSKKFDEIERL